MTPPAVTRTALRWEWIEDVEAHRDELGAMLAASVTDDAILGYLEPPSAEQVGSFVGAVQRTVTEGEGHLLLGSADRGALAMAVMAVSPMPNCRHIAEVSKAYLAPSVRGSRAVVELADEVAARATALGVEMLVIDVREGSKAHAVWTRMGFVTFGTLPDYSRTGDQRHNGCYMFHSVHKLAGYTAERLSRHLS